MLLFLLNAFPQRQAAQSSALAALMSFSVKLSDMEQQITSYDRKIQRQSAEINQLSAKLDNKADRSQFRDLTTLLNSKMTTVKGVINTKELVIERYRNHLRNLEGEISVREFLLLHFCFPLPCASPRGGDFARGALACFARSTNRNKNEAKRLLVVYLFQGIGLTKATAITWTIAGRLLAFAFWIINYRPKDWSLARLERAKHSTTAHSFDYLERERWQFKEQSRLLYSAVVPQKRKWSLFSITQLWSLKMIS